MAVNFMLMSPLAEVQRTDQLINGGQRILLCFLSELGITFGRCGTGVPQYALNMAKA